MTTQQHIVKVDGEVVAREKLVKWIERLLDRLPDGEVILEIRPCDISEQQRKYYYSQVGKMAASYGMSTEDLHRRFKMNFYPSHLLEIGCTSITDLNQEEMSAYIDECVRFSADQDYIWEDPEEYKHLK